MTPKFEELLRKKKESLSAIDVLAKEKEAFSAEISKSSKEIAMLKELVLQVNKGSIDSRCKWLWESGSMNGFTYQPSELDKDDILRINDKILEEENNRINLALAAKDCKEASAKLQENIPYMLISAIIKSVRTSTDDSKSSAAYGSIIYLLDIDKYEYAEDGKLTFSSHRIKYVPQEDLKDGKSYEWREVKTPLSGSSKDTDSLIQHIPMWNYIIKTFLKKRIDEINSKP